MTSNWKPLDWRVGGVALGLVFFLAILLVRPIGVSTQFVIFGGMLANLVNPDLITKTAEGYTSTNAYLDGRYAKSILNPMNYSFVFVIAMMIGAFISARIRGGNGAEDNKVPALWRANFGDNAWLRYGAVFGAGFLVLYGARLASGCSSGHMMSGMMQTSLSGYMFALGAFGAAIPLALIMYKKEG